MTELKLEKLTPTVGAEVFGVDAHRLANDEDLPPAVMAALDEHGVLLFREVGTDDHAQARFGSRLGDVVKFPEYEIPEVMVVSLDPDVPNAEYFLGNQQWHIDDCQQAVLSKATVLTAHRISPEGGETEFASTYAAYEDLARDEKERFASLRVFHSLEPTYRRVYDNPTPEQVAEWRRRSHEQPLVFTHRDGRRSLTIGSTADYIVGMDRSEGQALLADLTARATTPDRVYQHTWSVGDMVIWDNVGTLHRAIPYDPASRREMHRTTIYGDGPQ